MSVKKVLVVDDVQPHLEALKSIVEKADYTVITASTGEEAVKKAKSELPDLVFLDIVMDDMDGYGACREILKHPKTKNIPVVFVTTKRQRADKLWAEKQGAKGLISKPYTDDEILNEIKKY